VLARLQTLATNGRGALLRLAAAARALVRNRTETRRVLSEEVYRVPEPLLDDVVRVRLEDLEDVEEQSGDGDPPRRGA
jgi:hypothetical protein